MAEAYKKLAHPTVGTGIGTVYTAPAATQAIVKHIRWVNVSGSAATVKMWHGGTTDAFIVMPAVTIGAGEFLEFEGTLCFQATNTLHMQASAANAIVASVYGLEIT